MTNLEIYFDEFEILEELEKEATMQGETVNHPAHYTFGKFEPIDVIEDWGLDFCLGNAVKYIARAGPQG